MTDIAQENLMESVSTTIQPTNAESEKEMVKVRAKMKEKGKARVKETTKEEKVAAKEKAEISTTTSLGKNGIGVKVNTMNALPERAVSTRMVFGGIKVNGEQCDGPSAATDDGQQANGPPTDDEEH